jgi:hypothetical protein
MKVVRFGGGLGTRRRGCSTNSPKPLAPIDYRPKLWHVMKYCAHLWRRIDTDTLKNLRALETLMGGGNSSWTPCECHHQLQRATAE